MDFGDIAMAAGGGALSGFIDQQTKNNAMDKLVDQSERRAELERIKAQKLASSKRSLARYKHGNEVEMEELKQRGRMELEGAKAGGKRSGSSKDVAALRKTYNGLVDKNTEARKLDPSIPKIGAFEEVMGARQPELFSENFKVAPETKTGGGFSTLFSRVKAGGAVEGNPAELAALDQTGATVSGYGGAPGKNLIADKTGPDPLGGLPPAEENVLDNSESLPHAGGQDATGAIDEAIVESNGEVDLDKLYEYYSQGMLQFESLSKEALNLLREKLNDSDDLSDGMVAIRAQVARALDPKSVENMAPDGSF